MKSDQDYLHYLSALDDVELELKDLRLAYAKQESDALRRGISSLQEYWVGRGKTIDSVIKILDKLREGKTNTSLF